MSHEGEQRSLEPLLARVLAPVDPPAGLAARVQSRLESISQLAADELEGWELAAMRDPRKWWRPVAAVLGGSAAALGLMLLGRHQRARTRRARE